MSLVPVLETKKLGAFGFRAERVAPAGVGAERFDRARLQRYLPPAAELARHDRDHAVVEVDVGPVEAYRLPDAHAFSRVPSLSHDVA